MVGLMRRGHVSTTETRLAEAKPVNRSQAFTLGRQPLVQSYLSPVPFPTTCNDEDILPDQITPRTSDQPSRLGMNIMRNRVIKILNGLYRDNGAHLSSLEAVRKIDREITAVLESAPWYLKINDRGTCPDLPHELECISWQHHIFHAFICLQHVRMYRPFLRSRTGNSWSICFNAVQDIFVVYLHLRTVLGGFERSLKFRMQIRQTVQAAIIAATFLLVERPTNPQRIRQHLETVATDLEALGSDAIPAAVEGRINIRKILNAYDRGQSKLGQTTFLPGIQRMFGGEEVTRQYLSRGEEDPPPNPQQPIGTVDRGCDDDVALVPATWPTLPTSPLPPPPTSIRIHAEESGNNNLAYLDFEALEGLVELESIDWNLLETWLDLPDRVS